LASKDASGATEVDPLIVMTGTAEADAGIATPTTPATIALTPSRRRRRDM
jgi:hypothetical protein